MLLGVLLDLLLGVGPFATVTAAVLGVLAAAASQPVLHVAKGPAPSAAETETPFPLARLRIPEADGVVRARLVDRLERTLGSVVGMVVAPAGYGKTTAMAQWARQASVDLAWYRVDSADSEEPSLVRGLAAAIGSAVGVPLPVADVGSLVHVL